jgi:hypothetical protein
MPRPRMHKHPNAHRAALAHLFCPLASLAFFLSLSSLLLSPPFLAPEHLRCLDEWRFASPVALSSFLFFSLLRFFFPLFFSLSPCVD